MALRVAVLGAGGTIAPALVRDLAESVEVGSLLLLDLDAERAQAVADAHGAGRAQARTADARTGLAGALLGVDVLVSSASYRVNLDAMEACLEAGCHYLDLGGLYWMTARQLELDSRFRAAGLLAVLGIGSSPGKTNLMARAAVDALGTTPDEVRVMAAGRDPAAPEGFSVPYALQTLLDELTLAPVAVRDGTAVELEPMADGGAALFPDPIGEADTIYTLHSEVLTFPESFGCRACDFRLSLSPALLSALRDLRDASQERIEAVARSARPPSARTVSAHVVEAAAGSCTARMTAVTKPREQWGLGGGVVSTATPAAATVRLLARGRIEARGALPPERCLEPGDLFAELELRNCTFETTEETAVTP